MSKEGRKKEGGKGKKVEERKKGRKKEEGSERSNEILGQ